MPEYGTFCLTPAEEARKAKDFLDNHPSMSYGLRVDIDNGLEIYSKRRLTGIEESLIIFESLVCGYDDAAVKYTHDVLKYTGFDDLDAVLTEESIHHLVRS